MTLALAIFYFGLLFVLSIYGCHRFMMVRLFLRHCRQPYRCPEKMKQLPMVTIQLPVFNERYVAERLIRAVVSMDYPADKLEIQVLDDSTDDTAEIVAELVAQYEKEGVQVYHIRRSARTGYKAGALAEGLKTARGEFVAVFDADFIPEPSFLMETLDHFSEENVGMVQGRWGHLNRNYSSLTRAQAILLDGHFVIEHNARFRSGRFFNFNGTAGVWRKCAIEDAGGWQHDTLTEDLDLSYRAQVKGWRFVYLDDVQVPAEIPVNMAAFKSQQFRWAKGSIQTAKKLLLPVMRSDFPLRVRAEAAFHLSANLSFLMMLCLSILMPVITFIRIDRGLELTLLMDVPLFLMATCSVCYFYLHSQRGKQGWLSSIFSLPLVLALGVGMSLNNSKAVIEALIGRSTPFVRTPKYDISSDKDHWLKKRYQENQWIQPLFEILIGVWFTPAILVVLQTGGLAYGSLPFLLLFQFGYLYVGLVSYGQSVLGGRTTADAPAQ